MYLALRIGLYALVLAGLHLGFKGAAAYVDRNAGIGGSVSVNMDQVATENDILFMGDSRTFHGLIPTTFEELAAERYGQDLSAYNLGRPGMQTPFFYFTLQNYLQETKTPPKVIFLNASYYLLGGRDWMHRIYLSHFHPTSQQITTARQSGLLSMPQALWWRVRSQSQILRSAKGTNAALMEAFGNDPLEIVRIVDGTQHMRETFFGDAYRGYFPRGTDHIDVDMFSGGRVFNPGLAEPVMIDFFRAFVDLAAEHDIQIIVYEYPWPPSHNTPKDISDMAHYREILERSVADAQNVTFIDYHPFLDHTKFIDPLHLNDDGAEILTSLTVDWTAEHFGWER